MVRMLSPISQRVQIERRLLIEVASICSRVTGLIMRTYIKPKKQVVTVLLEVTGNWAQLNFILSGFAEKRLKIE